MKIKLTLFLIMNLFLFIKVIKFLRFKRILLILYFKFSKLNDNFAFGENIIYFSKEQINNFFEFKELCF